MTKMMRCEFLALSLFLSRVMSHSFSIALNALQAELSSLRFRSVLRRHERGLWDCRRGSESYVDFAQGGCAIEGELLYIFTLYLSSAGNELNVSSSGHVGGLII